MYPIPNWHHPLQNQEKISFAQNQIDKLKQRTKLTYSLIGAFDALLQSELEFHASDRVDI